MKKATSARLKAQQKRLDKMYKTSPSQMIHFKNLWGKMTPHCTSRKLKQVM